LVDPRGTSWHIFLVLHMFFSHLLDKHRNR